jgi:hypothetical protein
VNSASKQQHFSAKVELSTSAAAPMDNLGQALQGLQGLSSRMPPSSDSAALALYSGLLASMAGGEQASLGATWPALPTAGTDALMAATQAHGEGDARSLVSAARWASGNCNLALASMQPGLLLCALE